MKKTNAYSLLALLLGAIGWVLYGQIFRTSMDAEKLIVRGSLPEILLWVLAAVVLVGAYFLTQKTVVGQPNRWLGTAGCLIYAAGVASLLMEEPQGPELLTLIYRGVACLTVVCLAASACMRLLDRRPWFLLEVGPCLMAILQLVECYQLWSERALVLRYVFGVGAVLSLMLFAYHRMADNAGLPSKRVHAYAGLLSCFFGCLAAAGGEFSLYFAASALWAAMEMTALQPAEA